MSLSESCPSLAAEQDGAEDAYDGAPEVAEYFDEMVDTGVHERYVDDVAEDDVHASDVQVVRDHTRTDNAREKMLERRRRTLITLAALVVVGVMLAVFVSPWVWVATAVVGAMSVGYLWHLRGEARREEERRLTRVARANRPRRTTGFETRHSDGIRTSFAAGAYTAPETVDQDVVGLDDEDVAFYDLADAPVADSVDLSGHDYYADGGVDAEYDYDDDAYGIHTTSATDEYDEETGWTIPKGA